jgi:SAM-dependent methyltransferase
MNLPSPASLPAVFGDIDIYLFDQLLKGRIREGMQLLDAGCGGGRNLHYLLQAGVHTYGADMSATAIDEARQLAGWLAPHVPSSNFSVADLTDLPYPDAHFDVVVCSAVLHFARDEEHFRCIVKELWRVLKAGGLFFSRLSTTIGMEGKLQQVAKRHYLMPHGHVWFLADEHLIREMVTALGAEMLEPLKSLLVEQERSMTTWVIRKQ